MESLFQLTHITFVFEMFRTAFGGIEWFALAYVICIAVFFIIGQEYLNVSFVYPLAFMALTIFNPFLIVPVSEVIGLTTRFRRLFWLIPVNLVLALVFTWISTRPRKLLLRAGAAILCGALVVCFGSSMRPYLRMPDNIYKVSNVTVEIADIINADSEATGTEKNVLYSDVNLLELREYDASIGCLLRRTDMLDWELTDTSEKSVRKVIKSGHRLHMLTLVSRYGIRIDRDVFLDCVQACGVHYIISNINMDMSDYFIDAGYEQIGSAGDFEIFREAL